MSPSQPYLNHVDNGLLVDLVEVGGLGLDDAHVVDQDADVEAGERGADVIVYPEGLVGEVGKDQLGLYAVLRFWKSMVVEILCDAYFSANCDFIQIWAKTWAKVARSGPFFLPLLFCCSL